jgi:hypothetical protein
MKENINIKDRASGKGDCGNIFASIVFAPAELEATATAASHLPT